MAEYGKPNDRLKEITDRLEQGIQDLFDSERYTAYLTTMSKFYNYSFNNTLLIALQRPDATLIAGYNAWQDNFKRHVLRGEHGIKILAPCPIKRQVEMEKIDPVTRRPAIGPDGRPVTETMEVTTPAFKVVTVFDVSQTEGEPLPALGIDELAGSVEQYPDFFEALKRVSPLPIGFEKIASGAKGYCNYEEHRIAIQEGMSEVQTVKTAIHEITQARLHDIHREKEKDIPPEQRKDRNTREVEAESVAYTVCQHYGIETSDYSFGYIAGWSGGRETKELKASLELIRSTAAGLITDIDNNFRELVRARTQETRELTRAEALAGDVDELMQHYDPAFFERVTDRAAHLKELAEVIDHGNMFHVQAAMLHISETSQEYGARAAALYNRLENYRDTFTIYQLKDSPETRDYRFEPLERLQAAGLAVDRANYRRIYDAPLAASDTLEGIYQRFNVNHPADYTGYSLSVSDIVVLHRDGRDTAHYVDSFGFPQVPQFLAAPQPPANYLETAEKTVEQNYNMLDGRINNTPATDSVEARLKRGETVTLSEILADAKEKPSVTERVKAQPPREKKPRRRQAPDLERG
jgi:antirestriction protein ArdC